MKSFTFAVDHRRNLEIHATGCRDLAHVAADNQWVALAPKAADAVKESQLPNVKTMACTNPIRMAAAGRGDIVLGEAEGLPEAPLSAAEESDAPVEEIPAFIDMTEVVEDAPTETVELVEA